MSDSNVGVDVNSRDGQMVHDGPAVADDRAARGGQAFSEGQMVSGGQAAPDASMPSIADPLASAAEIPAVTGVGGAVRSEDGDDRRKAGPVYETLSDGTVNPAYEGGAASPSTPTHADRVTGTVAEAGMAEEAAQQPINSFAAAVAPQGVSEQPSPVAPPETYGQSGSVASQGSYGQSAPLASDQPAVASQTPYDQPAPAQEPYGRSDFASQTSYAQPVQGVQPVYGDQPSHNRAVYGQAAYEQPVYGQPVQTAQPYENYTQQGYTQQTVPQQPGSGYTPAQPYEAAGAQVGSGYGYAPAPAPDAHAGYATGPQAGYVAGQQTAAGYQQPNYPPTSPTGYQQPDYQQSGYVVPQQGYAPQPDYAPQGAPGYAQSSYQQSGYTQPGYPQFAAPSDKSKLAAGLLGIFLGAFGVHNFYLGNTGKAIAQLLITVLSLFMLSIVSEIWGLVEGVMILSSKPGTKWHQDAQGRELQD